MGRLARVALGLVLAIGVAGVVPGCGHGGGKAKGGWHVVKPGDTLWRLSQRYDTTVAAIEKANDGIDPYALRVGQRLRIPPGGKRGKSSRSGKAADVASGPRTLEQRDSTPCGDLARRDGLEFEWPVLGTLTSGYGGRGGRNHDGIDIVADSGTPVRAAEAGRVVYEGDDLGAYGKVVILKHIGRWATVYAHNRKNRVDEGDFVEKGDVIAEVGDTGNASAPHLHFEVRRANNPRDPQSCLP
jgi:murein DD-endopeptidase MepM/ murein hydrolase activator NlpD